MYTSQLTAMSTVLALSTSSARRLRKAAVTARVSPRTAITTTRTARAQTTRWQRTSTTGTVFTAFR
jgi:hypothetical protein